MGKKGAQPGFTIVELLIVVVVIAILAAITIVSYNGVSQRAKQATLTSTLVDMKKKIAIFQVTQGTDFYPGDLSSIDIPNTSSVFRYAPNNATAPVGYCLDATQSGATYFITEATDPAPGQCDESYGIAGWWTFNGNYSDTVKGWGMGSSGSPSYVAGQNGQASGAMSFNGSNQAVATSTFHTNSLNYGAVSISGWVYPSNNPASNQGYFGIRAASDPQYYVLQVAGTNTLECRVWPTGAGAALTAGTVSVTPSTWNFIALVYDGSNVRCYVNGVSGMPTAGTGTFNFGSNTFSIGRVGSAYFSGRIDDVRTYARVLSPSEITSMYQRGAQ